MKNDKGFTLVELLAVITILAIIMTIATINVGKSIKESKEKARYMAAKEIVEIAAAYMEAENKCATSASNSTVVLCKDSSGNLKVNSLVRVYDLCDKGFIGRDSTNPNSEDAKTVSSCGDFGNQYVRFKGNTYQGQSGYGKLPENKGGTCKDPTCYYYKFNGYVYAISGYE